MKPYYEDDKIALYHGDALEVLPSLPTGSADVMLLDPPYSMVPNAVRGKDDGAAGTSGAPMRLLTETAMQTRRILDNGGIGAFISDWRRVPDVSYLITLSGLRIATCVAWTRTTIGTGGLYRGAWDPILITSNGTPVTRDNSAVPNVISVNSPRPKIHPYEKPVGLWRHIVDRAPQGVVVDPFAGSGSSAIASLQSGHKWIGAEIDESHCEKMANRFNSREFDFGGAA